MKIDVHCNKCKYDGITNLAFDIFSLHTRHDFSLGHCQYCWNINGNSEAAYSSLHCMNCGSTDVNSKDLDNVLTKRGIYSQLDFNISL